MPKLPNIVLITDDQDRYDAVAMTEAFPARTPHLEQFAREGVWHRHAYSSCPLCMPARGSLHTGVGVVLADLLIRSILREEITVS
jgi:arylsulfatase